MTTLTTVFSEVLADLAFMFSEEAEVETRPDARWLDTHIRYEGPITGTLKLRCTREFSVLLAANLLGIDPLDEDAEEQALDAVREFMNIVCGQYITAAHGVDDIFHLTIPETVEMREPPDLSDDPEGHSATFTVSGQQLQIAYEPGGEAVACHPASDAKEARHDT